MNPDMIIDIYLTVIIMLVIFICLFICCVDKCIIIKTFDKIETLKLIDNLQYISCECDDNEGCTTITTKGCKCKIGRLSCNDKCKCKCNNNNCYN